MVIALLLPGVFFLLGGSTRERYSKEIVRTSGFGEIGIAFALAIVLHLLAWTILGWLGFQLDLFLFPLKSAKIGVSKNVSLRMEGFSNASPDRLVRVAWLECPTIGVARSIEKRLLGSIRRAGRHLRGEWITIDEMEMPLVIRYAEAIHAEVLDKAKAQE